MFTGEISTYSKINYGNDKLLHKLQLTNDTQLPILRSAIYSETLEMTHAHINHKNSL